MADDGSKSDFVVGLLVGGALGAALALLYAPQSGDETRDTLKKKSDELKEQTASLAAQVKDSSANLASTIREKPAGAGSATPTQSEVDGIQKATGTEGSVAFPA